MNRKQLLLVLLALAIIGGAGLVLFERNRQSWAVHEAKVGDKVLPGFQVNDVATIQVRGQTNFSVIRKNGRWVVPERGGYPANYDQIRDLLIKLRDLKVVRSETIGPSQLARVDLNIPGRLARQGQGTLITFNDARGGELAALLLGKRHALPQKEFEPLGLHGLFDGRYVLLPREPKNVLLVSDELALAGPDPGSWLNQDFFKITHVRFLSLASTNPAFCWELSRDNESSPWRLAGLKPGEVLETNLAAQTAEVLAFPRFVDVVPRTTGDPGLEHPAIITALTEHLAWTLKIGARRLDGNYPMTISVTGDTPVQPAPAVDTPGRRSALDEEFKTEAGEHIKSSREQKLAAWIYVVDSWVEPLLRSRSQFLEPKSMAGVQSAGP